MRARTRGGRSGLLCKTSAAVPFPFPIPLTSGARHLLSPMPWDGTRFRTAKQEQALRFLRPCPFGQGGEMREQWQRRQTTAVGWSLAHGMATKPYIVSRLTPSKCVAELSTFATHSRQSENCGFGALRKSVAKGLGFSSPPPITGNCGFGVWNNHVENHLSFFASACFASSRCLSASSTSRTASGKWV